MLLTTTNETPQTNTQGCNRTGEGEGRASMAGRLELVSSLGERCTYEAPATVACVGL